MNHHFPGVPSVHFLYVQFRFVDREVLKYQHNIFDSYT